MDKISTLYLQLGKVFEVLENARFTPNVDFGANPVDAYQWYISPMARKLLDKRNVAEWMFIKYNPLTQYQLQAWVGHEEKGATIKLKLAGVPEALTKTPP